jgi:chemotaxis protein methyltransferase CheR
LKTAVFRKFRTLIHRHSGIVLADSKEPLLVGRIGSRMKRLGLADPEQYLERITNDPSGEELGELLNSISTNVTRFFREMRHFEVLADLAAEWARHGERGCRIWSAGCSSGEEPFSIAFTLAERLGAEVPFSVEASDISTRVLALGRAGIYKARDVEGIDLPTLQRCFLKGEGSARELFRVRREIRERVSFTRVNLSAPPYGLAPGLHAIFCRNVMFYFSQELRERMLTEFDALLRPGGVLIIGLAETLAGEPLRFTRIEPSVYMKV